MRRWFYIAKSSAIPRDGSTSQEGTATTDETNNGTAANTEGSGNNNSDDNSDSSDDSDDGGGDSKDKVTIDKDTAEFLSLLQNPRTRATALAQLAKEVGMDLVDASQERRSETKKGPSTKEQLEQRLPAEWKFLADSLAPLFDPIIQANEELKEQLSNSERNRLKRDSESAERKFKQDFPDAKKYERRIVQLMQQYPPKGDTDMYEYLTDMYNIAKTRATGGLSRALERKAEERINRNSNDGSRSSFNGNSTNVRTGSNQKVSLKEAVRLAAQNKRVE